ncbi:DUF433 domain-containing protein [Persephonella sp.]
MDIYREKNIRGGKFVFRGTRITVEDLVESILSGMPPEEIEEEYPSIKGEFFVSLYHFMKKLFHLEISKKGKGISSQKDVEDIYRYRGCLEFLERLPEDVLITENPLENPEMVFCLKTFLKILKNHQSPHIRHEIPA